MRIPLTKYGLPQLIAYPLLVCILMVVLFFLLRNPRALIPAELALFLVFLWMLSFFRDPARSIESDETVLFSPADGTVTDITQLDPANEAGSVLGEKVLRIGIFLSVFNVHINRSPCSVRIESIVYRKGRFKNAMSPEAGKINESNDIIMVRLYEPKDRLLVRQISGAIARHIVCRAAENDEYSQGDQFGMIKFGSRTELYIPMRGDFEVKVKTGDKVRAGLTPLIRYKR